MDPDRAGIGGAVHRSQDASAARSGGRHNQRVRGSGRAKNSAHRHRCQADVGLRPEINRRRRKKGEAENVEKLKRQTPGNGASARRGVKARTDPYHWLAYGVNDPLAVMVGSGVSYYAATVQRRPLYRRSLSGSAVCFAGGAETLARRPTPPRGPGKGNHPLPSSRTNAGIIPKPRACCGTPSSWARPGAEARGR